MFRFKTLTAKNFMSVGNVTQAVNFDRNDLTLVLGENIDMGGDDTGSRNGTGKTTILNALSYALFGQALTNIKQDNLINKTNGKNMLVTFAFDVNGTEYRIERGRKPKVMKFYVGDVEKETTDNSQGDSRETQQEIEKLIEMSHDMFKHIVGLNTYTEPFLSMKAADQRTIIEQLLGITLLSEKAEVLKALSKVTKESINEEEIRIKAIQDANLRIQDQINSLTRRQNLWIQKNAEDVTNLQQSLDALLTIDIDAEIASHKALVSYNQKKKDIAELDKWIESAASDMAREEKTISKLEKEIADLEAHTCYACGQNFHDEKHEQVLESKRKTRQEAALQYITTNGQWIELTGAKLELGELGPKPSVFYDKEEDAIHHRSTIAHLQEQLASKLAEVDPYADQIEEMTNVALADVNYDKINELTRIREHQEFLVKLLTNKDSFVRKRIIDQNLAYLNSRLGYYLERIGLPHEVKFQNDLTVEINELGRDLDFDNLSRGERNRLILSLSWAFRDVWEGLYHPINLLFIDELVDSGMDTSGVESALTLLKKMSRDHNKSVWLVSHKDELTSRVNNIMTVVKENGFTTYNND